MTRPRFRLLTINLFSRWADPDDFADTLATLDPDVVVAQELAPHAAEIIAERFPTHHLRPDIRFSGWGMASRLPVVIESRTPGWGRGGTGRLLVEGRTVNVAGAHILDPMHRPLTRTRVRRLEQADALVAWGDSLPADEPQVVAGDMNATASWEVYRRLAARWTDLVLEAARDSGHRARNTWGPPGSRLRLLRIDHVFGVGLRAETVRLRPVKGTDHSALAVDLVLD
ncbi:MAG: endonuclease/exonuclease/phosphatase family protein [Actinobacteria bacterium]|nr:endonuclease/exonuclease/phosphatase family protein [Actinomycetota bacterium]